jgi:hypothetical protein
MALALRRWLAPLRLLGVPTHQIALTLLLSLRFMSLVFEGECAKQAAPAWLGRLQQQHLRQQRCAQWLVRGCVGGSWC